MKNSIIISCSCTSEECEYSINGNCTNSNTLLDKVKIDMPEPDGCFRFIERKEE